MQVEKKSREQLKQELLEQELVELRTRNAALEQSQAESEQVRRALGESKGGIEPSWNTAPTPSSSPAMANASTRTPPECVFSARPVLQNSGLRNPGPYPSELS